MKIISTNRIVKNWALPLIIAVLVFLIVKPVLAQTMEIPHDVVVGTISDESGFRQIYYESNGAREIITNGRFTSASPVTQNGRIVWVSQINGLWQIFSYDILSKAATQLTFMGNNVNPRVDEKGRIVWEGWVEGAWQIFFFDGSSVRQLTSGDLSLNPDFGGDYLSYGRRGVNGTWRAVVYSIKDNKSIDVTLGENAKNPKIRNGDIYLGAGSESEEKFPLSVSDLFLLNLTSLTATDSASLTASSSANPILEELSATASGVVEIIPQSTSSAQSEASPIPSTSE